MKNKFVWGLGRKFALHPEITQRNLEWTIGVIPTVWGIHPTVLRINVNASKVVTPSEALKNSQVLKHIVWNIVWNIRKTVKRTDAFAINELHNYVTL